MHDREKVIKGLQIERECVSRDCDRNCGKCDLVQDRDWLLSVYDDAIELLKEQEERLRKLQKDKDKLCLEVSEWKHKFHDAPPKFVPQGVVDQIRWERDTALSQLEEIGKGLGEKMDDIVAMLKVQEAKQVIKQTYHVMMNRDYENPVEVTRYDWLCPTCKSLLCRDIDVIDDNYHFCKVCGQAVKWNE